MTRPAFRSRGAARTPVIPAISLFRSRSMPGRDPPIRWFNGARFTETDNRAAADGPASMDPGRVSPPGNLLAITLLFALTAELLIYAPSITYFYLHWLNDGLAAARTAVLAIAAAPGGTLPDDLMLPILGGIDAKADRDNNRSDAAPPCNLPPSASGRAQPRLA
jgi:hypothetical protein